MHTRIKRTAEHVSEGHPDKFCDQVADRILDEVLTLTGDNAAERDSVRTAIECLAKDKLLIVSGEVKLPDHIRGRLPVVDLAREVWARIGYGIDPEELTVLDHVRSQTADIAQGVDVGGAGDQGIMVGYATDETPEFLPSEYVYARNICLRLAELRKTQKLPWLRSDCKSQVTIDADGKVLSVVVAAQHVAPPEGVTDEDFLAQLRGDILSHVIAEVLPNKPDRLVVNGTGTFVIGGPTGDAGVVGRKIVVDAYGPRVPVGGGAYSGKDPTKVDRSAAYFARLIAKTVVAEKIEGARECTVKLAYAIGQPQPEMLTVVTETGADVSEWVKGKFGDLSPRNIIERLRLRKPEGWSYLETAAYGHYGRDIFPWEKVS
ncbi:MAG: methionine adenosyltransferase [Acidobacteria bacterium]|nr:methionine adenosyltransferase [Acidobacteriota bacterium]